MTNSVRVRLCGSLLLVMLSLALAKPVVAEQDIVTSETNGVEVIRRGEITMFRYRDANGNLIIEDRPPPQFFDVEEVEAAEVAQVEPEPEVINLPPPPEPLLPRWIVAAWWTLISFMVIVAPLVYLKPRILRWLGETPLDRSLRLAELPTFADVKLSTGAHTLAQVDRIVRTPTGILLLAVEKMTGEIRGTVDAQQWLCGTDTIANPLLRIRHAEQLVQKIVSDVPVFGRVIDTGNARYPNGMPAPVQKLNVFKGALPAFADGDVAPRQIDGAWRTLMRFPRSNDHAARVLGVGWLGWVRRHPYETAAATLLGLAAIMAILLVILQRF